ncbi:MAG: hypothetical protein HYY24_03200, partial [Verrucomicrobia bacterium]|nr:hypothetical protein [Verrucomicrobiota bacterium]
MGYDLAYTVYRSRYRSPAAAVTHVAADRVINEMREAQAESLSQLCEQHTGTLGKLETIRDTIEVSALAICAELNWGFARVCDYLQHQQESLRKIIEILERPLETAALELKRRAEAAYNNRWTDEAIRDFEKARDLNYADFTVYLYLGNLYFFDKENAEEALKNYVGAAKFSRPHSAEYAARSLLHISLIERCAGNHQKTYATTQEAMALAPNLLGVEYEHAVNACLAQKPDEALALLETAIRADAVLAVKAASDPDFAQVSSQVAVLIDRLRDEAKLEALQHLNLAERLCEATSRFDFNFVPSAKSTIAE